MTFGFKGANGLIDLIIEIILGMKEFLVHYKFSITQKELLSYF